MGFMRNIYQEIFRCKALGKIHGQEPMVVEMKTPLGILALAAMLRPVL
jgi:hypothetical protein